MLFSAQISLVTISEAGTSLAAAIAAGTKSLVYADKESVKRSEYYQAAATGLNPTVVWVIRTVDYADQNAVEWGVKQYRIIRTFDRPDEMTELVCSGV